MKTIEVWSEGYIATGEVGGACLHGRVKAPDLLSACRELAKDPEFARLFDEKHMTYWGCRLFDNEKDARETFG